LAACLYTIQSKLDFQYLASLAAENLDLHPQSLQSRTPLLLDHASQYVHAVLIVVLMMIALGWPQLAGLVKNNLKLGKILS
jgi:hypothetical protein